MSLGMDQSALAQPMGMGSIPNNAQTYVRQRITSFPVEIREQDNISITSLDDRTSIIEPTQTPQPVPSDPPPEALEVSDPEPLDPPSPLPPPDDLPTFDEDPEDFFKKQKKRMANPSILTEEQKLQVAEQMSESNLGLLCNVCGKIFKSRDALDFHIMYTKLPGHDVLQQQKVKNNYAQEAMRISAKLNDESSGLPPDYGPPTPVVNYDQPPTPASVNDEVRAFRNQDEKL